LDLAGNPGALERTGESHAANAAANHDAAHTMGSSLSFRVLVARRNNLIAFNVSARLSMNPAFMVPMRANSGVEALREPSRL